MNITLNWHDESPENPDVQISTTGEKTYIELYYKNDLWHCIAFYKWTHTQDHDVIASWSSKSREECINAIFYDINVQKINFPSYFPCHLFNFGETT